MGVHLIFFSLVVSGTFVACLAGSVYQDEERLMKNLLMDYNSHLRPVLNSSTTIKVKVGLALIQIMELDESKQVLHTLVWFRKAWTDELLKWNPSDYGGIRDIRLNPSLFWKPDIILYNNAHDKWEYSIAPLAVVHYTGDVLFIPPMHLHSSCSIDLLKFPYDTQICSLKFGSWTYDGHKVDVVLYDGLEEIDLNDFIPSNEWKVVSSSARRNEKYYPCCPEPYPDLTFQLTLKRISVGHYTYTLIAPSVILALIIPIVFLLPSGSSEKTSLGVGVMLGLILLAIMIQSMLPNTGYNSFSALAVYNMMCVALTAISLAFSALVNGLWWKNGELPLFVRQIVIDKVGKLVCVFSEKYRSMSKEDADAMLPQGATKPVGDWQLLSIILDRFLLIIFLLTVIIITAVMH